VSVSTQYCTVSDVKAGTNITDSTLDTEISSIIDDVSRAIDDKTAQRFYPDNDANQVRYFLPENTGRCDIFPLNTFTSLTTFLDPTDQWQLGTDFYLEPLNAPADGAPWTALRTIARPFLFSKAEIPQGWAALDGRITITGNWGWATVAGPVHRACVLQSRRIFARRNTPMGYEMGSIETGGMRVPRLDPDVEGMLAPYVLTWFA
jgi:hypothetical protein